MACSFTNLLGKLGLLYYEVFLSIMYYASRWMLEGSHIAGASCWGPEGLNFTSEGGKIKCGDDEIKRR